jgi:hypothetical protein
MKYVWASWAGKNAAEYFPAAENVNSFKTRRIRGYGCAVTFTSTRFAWSSPVATYVPELKSFSSCVATNAYS